MAPRGFQEEVFGREFGRGVINNGGLTRLKEFEKALRAQLRTLNYSVKSRDALKPYFFKKLNNVPRAKEILAELTSGEEFLTLSRPFFLTLSEIFFANPE